MQSCCLRLCREREPPTCLQPPNLAHPTAKDAAAVRGVTCVPEEGSTAPQGLTLPQPELAPPQIRCDAPSRAGEMVAPGQCSGADPAEDRGRQV